MRRLLLATALMASVVLAVSAQAEPGRVVTETVHLDNLNTIEGFCDTDMVVQSHFVADLKIKAMPRGSEGLIYFATRLRATETFMANGKTVVSTVNAIDKDLRVTDNGDGTLTIITLSTGNAVIYNSDGKAIGRNPGQIRFEIVVDHGGTPTDPTDDTEISFEVVKESTGRTDDFCEAMVPALS
ncbi:MAG TPA: hypothetical protein VNB86_12525 [Gaiellaceae bacterium]|jgi:hypothetical protein|nr:hypothetical protein [Gaiellaceae bacterium]